MARLNALEADDAFLRFVSCGGSTRWAKRMVESRPFANGRELLGSADRAWQDLMPGDWLEAFRSHPRIGERSRVDPGNAHAEAWAVQEQAKAQDADTAVLAALADANRRYEERFGHIFIVCATGKTADEMLAMLGARLTNDSSTELRIAAGEQQKIAGLRLEKLVLSLGNEKS